ncbi:glycosyltransferase family 4 protein [Chloroflexota bacterium]
MQICMIAGEFPPNCSGPGYHVYHLARRLVRRGHKVVVITRGTWQSNWRREFVEGVEVFKVRYMPVYPFHTRLHGIFVSRVLQRLGMDFDVLHLHSPLVPYLRSLPPYIATQHGTTRSDIEMQNTHTLYSMGLKLFRHSLIAADRKISRNASIVIAVSRSCAIELQHVYGVCADKIVTIPNGVDTDFFVPVETLDIVRGPSILYSGRLDARKGVEDLVPCAAHICSQRPEVRFVIAGDGPLASKMKRMVSAANLDANFRFVGFLNHRHLLEHYQQASVFVLPSYYEGLPLSLLEAMSCGIPVVATDIDGNSEVIADGETGLLVPPGDPHRLAVAILKFLDDDGFRRQIGASARRHIAQNYDWELIVDRIERAYNYIV